MQAKRQLWKYADNARVWAGRYRNSHNMPHWHDDCELLTVTGGQLDVCCSGSCFSLSDGQSAFIDSEQVHWMHAAAADTVAEVIIFSYDIIRPFASGLKLVSPRLTCDYGAQGLYSSLREKLRGRQKFYEYDTALNVAAFMLEVFRQEKTEQKKVDKTEKFKGLLSEIDERLEYCDISSAAQFMNMNATYFSRLFHEQMGITFSRYLNYVRVGKAVDMLNAADGQSMTDIAMQCGFSTIRSFNRIFKEYTGYAPGKIPANYMMKESFSDLSSAGQNPTLDECELLESSDTELQTPSL